MNASNLSPRLRQVADYLKKYGPSPLRMADIGSDHAYLPCYLALDKVIEYAVAGEVVEGPYQSALKQVTSLELDQIIQVRKGDGFEVVDPSDHLDAASICGMGGLLILEILERGRIRQVLPPLLVLQANNAVNHLRAWIQDHSYQLVDECVLEDKGRYYQVLVARQGGNGSQMSDQEILLGPYNLRAKTPAFKGLWAEEVKHRYQVVDQIKGQAQNNAEPEILAKLEKINQEIQSIEEALQDDPA